MLKINNHIIQINLVEGFEYFDNIGKILKDFTEKKPNLNFDILNSKELLINEANDYIDQFFINQNNIRIVAHNEEVLTNASYLATKALNISQKISVQHYNRIGVRCNFRVEDEGLKKDLRDKLFSGDNIKYFSLTYDDLKINDKISCSIRVFTGTKTTFDQKQTGDMLTVKAKQDKADSREMLYVVDVDIFYKNDGVEVSKIPEDMNFLLDSTLKKESEFFNVIKNHILKAK